MREPLPPVVASVRVEAPVARAFEVFTRDIGRWWPMAYTFAGERLETIQIRDGQWLERDVDGGETSWGAVTEWDPPRRFTAEFAVSPQRAPEPPDRRSRVRFEFRPAGDGCEVVATHDRFERHGEGAAAMREGMASTHGWPLILAEYARETRGR